MLTASSVSVVRFLGWPLLSASDMVRDGKEARRRGSGRGLRVVGRRGGKEACRTGGGRGRRGVGPCGRQGGQPRLADGKSSAPCCLLFASGPIPYLLDWDLRRKFFINVIIQTPNLVFDTSCFIYCAWQITPGSKEVEAGQRLLTLQTGWKPNYIHTTPFS